MRISFVIPLLMVMAYPGVSRSAPTGDSPAVAADRNQARWADWEAQARMAEGVDEGAVQAEHQAETDRHEADRQEMLARAWKR